MDLATEVFRCLTERFDRPVLHCPACSGRDTILTGRDLLRRAGGVAVALHRRGFVTGTAVHLRPRPEPSTVAATVASVLCGAHLVLHAERPIHAEGPFSTPLIVLFSDADSPFGTDYDDAINLDELGDADFDPVMFDTSERIPLVTVTSTSTLRLDGPRRRRPSDPRLGASIDLGAIESFASAVLGSLRDQILLTILDGI